MASAYFFFFSSRRRHTRLQGDWSSDVCSSDLGNPISAKYSAGAGQGGWLAYVTHGFYEGTGRRTDRSSWFTMEGYSQAGYANQSMASRFTLTDQTNGALVGDGSGRYKREQWFFSTEEIGRASCRERV